VVNAVGALRSLLASGDPLLLVIAGPNGAGKTTFFETTLERQLRIPFVNADRIARTLPKTGATGGEDEVAFRAATLMREQLLSSRVSFCMETVFSDPVGDKLEFFRAAQRAGYIVSMVFVGLASAELSARRVEQRVADGGHDVPADRIRKRFPRVMANLASALPFLDQVIVFDNSGVVDVYREIALYERGKAVWLATELPGWFDAVRKAKVRRLPPLAKD
jgi:predicted ABC-type ATPase